MFSYALFIDPLPKYKILDVTKLKAFADDKLNVVKMMISFFLRVENAVGKGENAGYQHFILFPQCFPKPSSLESLKSGFCGKELKLFQFGIVWKRFYKLVLSFSTFLLISNPYCNWAECTDLLLCTKSNFIMPKAMTKKIKEAIACNKSLLLLQYTVKKIHLFHKIFHLTLYQTTKFWTCPNSKCLQAIK